MIVDVICTGIEYGLNNEERLSMIRSYIESLDNPFFILAEIVELIDITNSVFRMRGGVCFGFRTGAV